MTVHRLHSTDHRLLTKQQLADLLQVHKRTIDNYVVEGMPFEQLKGQKRFWADVCLEWLSERYGTGKKPT